MNDTYFHVYMYTLLTTKLVMVIKLTDWHQIWHTCANSYGNVMDIRQTNCPSRHKGGTWGVLGVQQFKNMGSCPIGTNFGSRLRIHLGMDIG